MNDEADSDVAEDYEPSEFGPESAAGDTSVLEDIRVLMDEGLTYAQAEVAYQRARLTYAGQHAKLIAILLGLAAAMVLFALFGLVFGAILTLAPMVGPAGATAIVAGALLVVAAILALWARSKAREVKNLFMSGDE